MSSIDTNVMVRYLVGDDAEQAEAARALLDGLTSDDPGFICREVVIEIAWVLERSYGFARARVAEALMDLTASDSILVENPDDVAAAAHLYRQGGVGFSDLMVLSVAERCGSYAPLHIRPQTCPDGWSCAGRRQDKRRVVVKGSQKPDSR